MSIVSLVIAPTLAHVYHTKDNSGVHTNVIKEKTQETAANSKSYKVVKMEKNKDAENENTLRVALGIDGITLSSNAFIEFLNRTLRIDHKEESAVIIKG